MIACDSYLSLFFSPCKKKLRSGAVVRFSDNSSSHKIFFFFQKYLLNKLMLNQLKSTTWEDKGTTLEK